jgi:hypothetical protein
LGDEEAFLGDEEAFLGDEEAFLGDEEAFLGGEDDSIIRFLLKVLKGIILIHIDNIYNIIVIIFIK